MKQHKWHKEIKAWADGAEIECFSKGYPDAGWQEFDGDWGEIEGWKFRIKPQPVEPQYLYAYNVNGEIKLLKSGQYIEVKDGRSTFFVGKIPLIVESNDD